MVDLVTMKNISKKFPGVMALDQVSFSIQAGEVHVLLGENGAGKSTLMKILSGAYSPTTGEIVVNNEHFKTLTPILAKASKISIIYQELSVVNELSILENIFLGRLYEKRVFGLKKLDYKKMIEETTAVLEKVGLKRSPSTIVGSLSISEKQQVEIAKAVSSKAQVIIMDEPTSSLSTEEIKQLFKIIEQLKKEQIGIVYISHKLNEITEIGDRVTVLKDGKQVGTYPLADVTEAQLVKLMIGREITGRYLSTEEAIERQKPLFSVHNLTRKDQKVRGISFELYPGEILGFSGLVGAGRTEIMEAIYGAAPIKTGSFTLLGEELTLSTTYQALKKGIVLVTENRRETGFSPYFSILENVVQGKSLKESSLGGFTGLIKAKVEKEVALKEISDLQIKVSSVEQVITELSGGNQQKVILGKWLATDPKLIIFDEPTKGIDVGTKAEFYKLMRELAKKGIGIIVVSSELPELIAVSDRIIVCNSGRLNGEFLAADVNEEVLVQAGTATVD